MRKIIAAKIARNVVMILVLPVLKTTPVLMLQLLNAVQLVIIAIPLVRQVVQLLIREHLLARMNADNLVKNVIMLVLPDTRHQPQPSAMTPPLMNAAILATKQKTATLVPVIMNVVEHGNIVKARLVRQIVLVAALIAKATTFLIPAVAIMVRVMEIIEAGIAPYPVIRLKQILAQMSVV